MTKNNCTLKTCTKCNLTKDETEFFKSRRFGRTHWCKQCFYLNAKHRQALYPELASKQNKEKCKTYYHKDLKKSREMLRKRWRTNPTYRKQVNDSKKTPRGRIRVARYTETRRIRSRYDGKITYEQVESLLELQNHKCNGCSRTFTDDFRYTLDHIFPLSKGGRLVWGNVQLLCRSCNSIKRDHI